MMVPSTLQAPPPPPPGVLVISRRVPSAMSTRYSVLDAKNAIDLLSGDQNGSSAPSVPVRGRTSEISSARSQRRGGPSADATKTRYRPSGDRANWNGASEEGVRISTRSWACGGCSNQTDRNTEAATAPATAAVTPHKRKDARRTRGTAGKSAAPERRMRSMSTRTSPAACRRSSCPFPGRVAGVVVRLA